MALGFAYRGSCRVFGRRQVSVCWDYRTQQSRLELTMSQTNWIGAFIAVGFIAYIIAKGQLTGYLQILGLASGIQSVSTNPLNVGANSQGWSSATAGEQSGIPIEPLGSASPVL